MNTRIIALTVFTATLLLSPRADAQSIGVKWFCADVTAAGRGSLPGGDVYTSSGQSCVGTSADQGTIVHSGFLTYEVQATSGPLLSAGSSLDFGNVTIGDKDTAGLIMQNAGLENLLVQSIETSGAEFRIITGGGPRTLGAGQQHEVLIEFSPAAEGARGGSLRIASNSLSGDTLRVPLSGTGVRLPTPAATLSAATLEYGTVTVGQSARKQLIVRNTGNALLVIGAQSIAGAQASEYTIVDSCVATIAAGGSDVMEIVFAPAAAGTRTATLQFTSNDPQRNSIAVSLYGLGSSMAQPRIETSPTIVDFGSTPPGTPVVRDVRISNSGGAALAVSGQTVAGNTFSLITAAQSPVAPGGFSTARVQFAPVTAGEYNGTFTIVSNDPQSPSVTINLRGKSEIVSGPRLALNTSSLDFGAVRPDSIVEKDLIIRNIGTMDLAIGQQRIAGADSLDFSIAQTASTPIIPGGSTTVRIRLAPRGSGQKSAIYRINSNDPTAPVTDVPLNSTVLGAEAPPLPDADLAVRIMANHPNPFATRTTIVYEVGGDALVDLDVYDVLGKHAAALLAGARVRAGTHSAQWNAAGLPPGLYIAQIRAKTTDGTVVRRRALLRTE